MIDWEKCSPQDFEIEVQGDEVNQAGTSLIFPVKVYHKNGELAFSHGVPIRADFYRQLKQREGWQEDLMVIICKRVRDELNERLKKQEVSIEDKVDFFKMERQPL
ncbi:MAG: hypothetical protein IID17_10505 [Nitrospinae bacterium]|nr:hypothetical protein [Nitrospinota bacterium]